MSHYTLNRTLPRPFDATVQAVRDGLAEQGFGVLTEIDLAAVLRAKIGAEVPAQVILGACRPELAHQALLADPSIAAVLPCNVVVRRVDDVTTVVEAFDPDAMVGLASGEDGRPLRAVAADARARIEAMLAALGEGAAGFPGRPGKPTLGTGNFARHAQGSPVDRGN